ncbi:DUF6036 family nucleotidyltransferase [Variovorax sp. dw_308]|uniref:DUF6036 family nucleotidyltransferase n=1 Tax=Variovorax sp. dw_308 TaxID=2721546 RepID=UPI001C4726A2|nr:DUF6036 family nucleotidyltransferase [Variovorax sp. dw_308]
MNHATPELAAALSTMLDRIDATLRQNSYQGPPIIMYLAGGMAVNYYCGTRVTRDVDASFSRRMALDYNDLIVDFVDATGKPTQLFFDTTYSPTLGPMHEDYEDDSREWVGIGNEQRVVRLRVLAPVDVGVSKLGRFEGNDRGDILALAARGYFTAAEFRRRAEASASYFVGNVRRLQNTIDIVCKDIDDLGLVQASTPGVKQPSS